MPTGNLSGYLYEDLTISEDVVINGDLIVTPTATLTFSAGAKVTVESSDALSSGRYPNRPEIIVEGTFVAVGNAEHPVTIESAAFNQAEGLWGGFQVRNGGSATMDYVEVKSVKDAFWLGGEGTNDLIFKNGTIQYCEEQGVTVTNTSNDVQLINNFIGDGACDINLKDGASVIRGNILDQKQSTPFCVMNEQTSEASHLENIRP